ncbi:MAG: amidohydrolase family protein [Candidatus Lokiarchaeia archaeon]
MDGTGNPWFKADLLVEKEKISRIEPSIEATGVDEVVDVSGLIVAPGFVDIHGHSELTIFLEPTARSKISQGVTTECVGNCGFSATPIPEDPDRREDVIKTSSWISEIVLEIPFSTIEEYIAELNKTKIGMNIVSLTGHGILRAASMGLDNREPTPDELETMKKYLEQELKLGSFGLSTGLDYPPGTFAKTNEIIELCKVVAKYNGIYATHIRNVSGSLSSATREAIKIGKEAGVPVQISHFKAFGKLFWGTLGDAYKIAMRARKKGLDVTSDTYPHLANSTGLFMTMPFWLYLKDGALDPEGFHEQIKRTKEDPELEKRVKEGIDQMANDIWGVDVKSGDLSEWRKIIVSTKGDPTYNGKSLEQIAREQNKDPEDVLIDIFIKYGMEPWGTFLSMKEDDNKVTLTHEISMISSDGWVMPNEETYVNPYFYAAFTQTLAKYVRELKWLTLPDAIRRMTSFPAQRLGLIKRGVLKVGNFADITVFDPDRVQDLSSYENPHQHSVGIEYVLVNGEFAIKGGKFTGARSGIGILKNKQKQ